MAKKHTLLVFEVQNDIEWNDLVCVSGDGSRKVAVKSIAYVYSHHLIVLGMNMEAELAGLLVACFMGRREHAVTLIEERQNSVKH